MGSEVIKVEPPDKPDPLREWGQARYKSRSLWWPVLSRNKKCVLMSGDEYVLDTPVVRAFVASVRAAIGAAASPEAACEAIRPGFADLLADTNWLPPHYQESAAEGGMGGEIGQWLLFRSADRFLSLFSLVVPPDAQTPVHDHLAWGLVGLYRGTQDEEIYAERDGGL